MKPVRTLTMLLAAALFLIVGGALLMPQEAKADTQYNRQAAADYAKAHCNDYGNNSCNLLVADSLNAGGLSIPRGGTVDVTLNYLLPYGSTHALSLSNGYFIYVDDYQGICDIGDVVFIYCGTCGKYMHTWIITGKKTVYTGREAYTMTQASPSIQSTEYWNYSDSKGHPTSVMSFYAVHITSTGTTPTYTAPNVQMKSVAGNEVFFKWNDVGAESYYVYAYNLDTQTTTGQGTNIGRQFSHHFTLPAGRFRIYVVAVYSSDKMETGWTDVTTAALQASHGKQSDQVFMPGESVPLSVNAYGCDSYHLQIARTPTGGETYIYYDGVLSSPSMTRCYDLEGYYSCGFYVTVGDQTYASRWIAWIVPQPQATNPKGEGGVFTTGEKVRLGIDALNLTAANLLIYQTKPGGEPAQYWSGSVNPNTFEMAFAEEGQYSCCYSYQRNGEYVASKWVGWSVEKLATQVTKGSLGVYEPGEPVRMSLNTTAFNQAWISVWRTPPGGIIGPDQDSYEYYSNTVNPNSFSLTFDQEGYYSCGYSIVYSDATYDSAWIAWYVTSSIHISYDMNGGAGAIGSQRKIYNEPLVLSDCVPVRSGYDFLGWATAAGAANPAYQPGDVFAEAGTFTLYAVWQAIIPDFILPDSTVIIEDYAFQGCAFRYARLSEATTTLGIGAFADCPNLKHIYLPSLTTSIGAGAIPAGVTIHGAEGSYAETYANTYGYDFIAE